MSVTVTVTIATVTSYWSLWWRVSGAWAFPCNLRAAPRRACCKGGHSATQNTGPSDDTEGGSWRAAENLPELLSTLSVQLLGKCSVKRVPSALV